MLNAIKITKKIIIAFSFIIIFTCFSYLCIYGSAGQDSYFPKKSSKARSISIRIGSDDLQVSADSRGILNFIPDIYAFDRGYCGGSNISPNIKWKVKPWNNIVKSYAVTMYNPDSDTGSGWWNWIVYNIPAEIDELETGTSKFGEEVIMNNKGKFSGVTAINDYGNYGYAGPCPPIGSKTQEYIITVYALRVERLPVEDGLANAIIRSAIFRHTVAKDSFKGMN